MSSSALTDSDKKFWPPIESLVKWLADRIPADAKVLEIGPGFVPFPRADVCVDYRDLPAIPAEKKVECDFSLNPLPFTDKQFDFVYCRHVLEDMYDPFHLIKEMQRVAKAGYIETPSPFAELCRGVDGSSPPFRGYHHHRYIIWMHENELRFVSKYPLIEYIRFTEEDITKALRQGAKFWNTYYLWTDTINFKHLESGPDYVITRDYAAMLKSAMDQSQIASGMFWLEVPDKVEIKQGALPSLTSNSNRKELANV